MIALYGFVMQFESIFKSVASTMQEDERQKEENARNIQGISTTLNPAGDWVMVHADYTASNTAHSDPSTSSQLPEMSSSPSQKPVVVRATSASDVRSTVETHPMVRYNTSELPSILKSSMTSESGSGSRAMSPPTLASSSSGSSSNSPNTHGDYIRRSPTFRFNSVYTNTWKVHVGWWVVGL